MDEKKLVDVLKERLGQNLLMAAAYGIGPSEQQSYVILTKKLDIDDLKQLAGIEKLPLFLKLDELRDGLDVFPLEFLNMKLHHRVLYGQDYFNGLNFDRRHVRRELEFEFRSKLISLREGFVRIQDSKKDLDKLVLASVPTLMPILNGLLFLKGKIPEHTKDIFEAVSEEYDAPLDVLKEIYHINKKGGRISGDELYVQKLIVLLEDLAEKLDKFSI